MAAKTKVLILGATGMTGEDIVDGLVEDGSFDVTVFTRPTSASGPAVTALRDRGLNIIVGDLRATVAELASHLQGIEILVSALGPNAQHDQNRWVDAAKQAGVKRFVPCGFTTIIPRGGVAIIRDEKELVHDHIFRERVPYTIIDVGYWHQISFPHLPSGKADYATIRPNTEIYGDGQAPNLLTDKRDIGRFVARIINDPRTLNKRVLTWSDEISQNQIWDLAEKLSGEKIPRTNIPASEVLTRLSHAQQAHSSNPAEWTNRLALFGTQYIHSKYIRADNTLENAKYLGYLDARELYPDFEPVSFESFFKELLAGKGSKPGGDADFAARYTGVNAVH